MLLHVVCFNGGWFEQHFAYCKLIKLVRDIKKISTQCMTLVLVLKFGLQAFYIFYLLS